MNWPASDLHVHSSFSCDGRGTMEAMCRQAVTLGLREIALTEHVDLVPADSGYGFFEPAAYWAEVVRCRELFDGQLTILAGVEVGETHRYPAEVAALLAEGDYDVVVGSLHWMGDRHVSEAGNWSRPVSACEAYFEELAALARAGGFDVLGHLDVIKRHVPLPYDAARYERLIRPVLAALVKNEIALEINTQTLFRPVRQCSPDGQVLNWYRELGGELLTFGSDAHEPAHLAAGFETALTLARAAGFDRRTTFRRRERRMVELV